LTISALAEGDSFGQAKQYLPWTSHLFNELKLRLALHRLPATALLLAYGNMRPSGGRAFENSS